MRTGARVLLTILYLAIGLFAAQGWAIPALAQGSVVISGVVPSKVDASQSTATIDSTELPADNSSSVIVTVTLRDINGILLTNTEATLSSNRGSVDIIWAYDGRNLTTSPSGRSDENGVIRYSVHSNAPGQATLSVLAETLVTLNNKPIVTFTALPILSQLTLEVELPSIFPGLPKKKIKLLAPSLPKTTEPKTTGPEATTTTGSSGTDNTELVNTGVHLTTPFWLVLILVGVFASSPVLILTTIVMNRRIRKGLESDRQFREKEIVYQEKEQETLAKIYQLEQQIAGVAATAPIVIPQPATNQPPNPPVASK